MNVHCTHVWFLNWWWLNTSRPMKIMHMNLLGKQDTRDLRKPPRILVGLGISSASMPSPHHRACLRSKNYKISACSHYRFSKFWHSFFSSHAEVRSPIKLACSPHFFGGCLFSQRIPSKMENNNRSPAGLHSTWNPLDCSRWVAKKKHTLILGLQVHPVAIPQSTSKHTILVLQQTIMPVSWRGKIMRLTS